jgi:hypothetical protein
MASHQQSEQDTLTYQLLHFLSGTRFQCTKLLPISGGSINYIFRGTLQEPFFVDNNSDTEPAKTVIIKHSTGFLSCNKDFLLEISRWASRSKDMLNRFELKY